jgi:hypothetical protein
VKRALLIGVLIGVAYFVVLAVLWTFAIPPGTDIFPQGTDFQSTRFHFGIWLGRYVLPPMAYVMTPLGWLPHPSTNNIVSWFIAVLYIFLLGVIVSFVFHGIAALMRHKNVLRATDI